MRDGERYVIIVLVVSLVLCGETVTHVKFVKGLKFVAGIKIFVEGVKKFAAGVKICGELGNL